jgi:hypothetical protein
VFVFKFISSKDQTITKEAFDKLSSSDLKSSGVISSPDKKINAVVYPFEFEQSGEIYIFDLGAGKGKKLLSENDIDNKLSIKYINFYDDENLIVILGNKYGTTSIGGDVYKLNMKTKELTELYKVDSKYKQVLTAAPKTDGLIITVAAYDENYNNFSVETIPITLNKNN